LATHYVDNKKLYSVIVQYKADVAAAVAAKQPKPEIPSYVGVCVLLIAQRLSTKPNFINYSYREEMVSDGIENCISYFDNFDPTKSDNPFAYFTQIIYYAFLRRIQKEKKQQYIKHKAMENSLVFNTMVEQSDVEGDEFFVNAAEYGNDTSSDFVKAFEKNLADKKVQRKKGVELFIDDADTEEVLPESDEE